MTSSAATLDLAELVRLSKFYVEGVGILSIGLVGLVINVLALSILFRKQVGSENLERITLTFIFDGS